MVDSRSLEASKEHLYPTPEIQRTPDESLETYSTALVSRKSQAKGLVAGGVLTTHRDSAKSTSHIPADMLLPQKPERKEIMPITPIKNPYARPKVAVPSEEPLLVTPSPAKKLRVEHSNSPGRQAFLGAAEPPDCMAPSPVVNVARRSYSGPGSKAGLVPTLGGGEAPLGETLGKLRTCEAVDMNWIGESFHFKCDMGRVYYKAFCWKGTDFSVGDFVHVQYPGFTSVLCRIVAAFQATKSFVSRDKKRLQRLGLSAPLVEIQKRGHPYVELCGVLENGEVDSSKEALWRLPDWLLYDQLSLCKAEVPRTLGKDVILQCDNPDDLTILWARSEWRVKSEAVQFVKHRSSCCRAPDCVLWDPEKSSDDSDTFSRPRPGAQRGSRQVELNASDTPDQLFVKKVENEAPEAMVDTQKLELARLLSEDPSMSRFVAVNSGAINRELLRNKDPTKLVDVHHLLDPHGSDTTNSLEQHRRALGYPELRTPQGSVCREICSTSMEPVIFVAPCGFGKTLCAMVSARCLRGITLIIEPLRALVQNQEKVLQKHASQDPHKEVFVERLLTRDDSLSGHGDYALDRLRRILYGAPPQKTYVFLTTPELLIKERSKAFLDVLSQMAEKGLLRQVVIDEFDKVQEGYRPAYEQLVQTLRKHCWQAKMVLLSATFTQNNFATVLSQMSETARPKLFMSRRPLNDTQQHFVESKISDAHCFDRIAHILRECADADNKTPMAICFCLTRQQCSLAVNRFKECGIDAELYLGANVEHSAISQTTAEKEAVLQRFERGETRLLCATEALGRGVNLRKDIQFAFFSSMPVSLTEYIQQCGRVGRDMKGSRIFLFFRFEDVSRARNVVQGFTNHGKSPLSKAAQLTTEADLKAVQDYCLNGWECRYSMLSINAVQFAPALSPSGHVPLCREDAHCDNCMRRLGAARGPAGAMGCGQQIYDISDIVQSLAARTAASLSRLSVNDGTSNILSKEKLVGVASRVAEQLCDENSPQTKAIVQRLLAAHVYKSVDRRRKTTIIKSILLSVLGSHVEYNAKQCATALQSIATGGNWYGLRSDDRSIVSLLDGGGRSSEDRGPTCPRSEDLWPFLVQYCWNCALRNGSLASPEKRIQIEEKLRMGDDIGAISVLFPSLSWCQRGDMHNVFLTCTLNEDGELIPSPPEDAASRRIYRAFGAHRFLQVQVSHRVSLNILKRRVEQPFLFCGRSYSYLWCKKEKCPQCYVFFAEEGIGIQERLSAYEVQNACIPRSCNPKLTVAEYSKRMKLCFSRTESCGSIQHGWMEVLPDFHHDGIQEFDGCGLVSPGALAYVWQKYSEQKMTCGIECPEACPFTGFQGRIGGIKGTWLLDPSLGDKISFLCRTSQVKYNSPPVPDNGNTTEPLDRLTILHHTVDVNSWDETLPGPLHRALIQLLGHHGVPYSYLHENCLKPLEAEVSQWSSSSRSLVGKLKDSNARLSTSDRSAETNSRCVYLMASAGVPSDEPEFCRRKANLVKTYFQDICMKGKYPMKDSCRLRLYADHTLLLNEGEAFVSTSRGCISALADHVLAMRSPSYFPGDLRRLKIVSIGDLQQRVLDNNLRTIPESLRRTERDSMEFFKSVRSALILSNRGHRAEADRMSGGDYDGDQAWVCWNKDLLGYFVEPIPEVEIISTCTKSSGTHLSGLWGSSFDVRLAYDRHFRGHLSRLGEYATKLEYHVEKYGFENRVANELGRAAFLQVDMPYFIAEPQLSPTEYSNAGRFVPHWKAIEPCRKAGAQPLPRNAFPSSSLLGRLFDAVVRLIEDLSNSQQEMETISTVVESFIAQAHDDPVVDDMRDEMRSNILLSMSAWDDMKANFETRTDWFAAYRQKLIEPRKRNPAADSSLLAGAVLYEQAFKAGDRRAAISFAWSVASPELCQIFLLDAVSSGSRPLMITPENERSLANRRSNRFGKL